MSLAEALKAKADELTEVFEWWSDFSPAPTGAPPGTTACRVFWFDRSRGRITHMTLYGVTYGMGGCFPGNPSGDGNWYSPITISGQPQLGLLPYPLCFDFGNGPQAITSDSELLVAVSTSAGVSPVAVATINGVSALCFNPDVDAPGSYPGLDGQPLCSIGNEVIVHSGTRKSFKPFCPPPPPQGSGGAANSGAFTQPFVNAGATYQYTYPTLPYTGGATTGTNRDETMWIGPVTVNCGNPILEFTVDYDSNVDHNPGNGNDAHGFAVISPAGTVQPVQGTTTEIVGDCTGTSYPTALYPLSPAAQGANVNTFQTLNPVAVGDVFWLQVINLRGTVNSVSVSCANP